MKIHLISGLPRSGSTLLAAILRQNPRFVASMTGPVGSLFEALVKTMSGQNEAALFIDEERRRRVLRSVIEAYYADVNCGSVIFDTNRQWCANLAGIDCLFPDSRVICCVRNVAWILDSVEVHIQKNSLCPSKMFNYDTGGTVYSRVDSLMKPGFVGTSLNALRQAWFGEHANKLIAVRYESLTQRPVAVMNRLYELLGEPPFQHDFENVQYDESDFDAALGLPGFHRVSGPVVARTRKTILPPDIFCQYDRSFWDMPGQNPRAVTVL